MKKIIILIGGILLFLLLSSCTDYSEIEKIARNGFAESRHYYVKYLKTGDVDLFINPPVRHLKTKTQERTKPAGRLFDRVYLTNGVFIRTLVECQGCDSCMMAYKNAGLITYEEISRDEAAGTLRAHVELTSQGRQYLIENYVPMNAKIQKLKKDGIELIVTKYQDISEMEVTKLNSDSDQYANYSCSFKVYMKGTPFFELVGGKENKEEVVDGWIYRIKLYEDGKPEIEKVPMYPYGVDNPYR